MKKIVDELKYNWNVKAALVYTLLWMIFVMSLCIPVFVLTNFSEVAHTDNVSKYKIVQTVIILIGYSIFALNVKSIFIRIFNWILNCIYQRTKWDGMFE